MNASDFPLRWSRGRSAPPLLVTDSGCWLWQGKVDDRGYGRLRRDGRDWLAHRWSYEHFIGPIGSLVIDHLCRNHNCVNPEHLEPVTDAINLRRGLTAKLSTEDVEHLRHVHSEWIGSTRGFARAHAAAFGVSEHTIRSAVLGFTWGEPKVRAA